MTGRSFLPSPANSTQAATSSGRFSIREAEEGWTATAMSYTGLGIVLTPVRVEDHDALEEFYERVSTQDLYFCFRSGLLKVAESRVEVTLCDDDCSVGFLALDSDDGSILAIAKLVANADLVSAEFTMCLREDAEQEGISWLLLDHVANFAAAKGVRQIFLLQSPGQMETWQLEQELLITQCCSSDEPFDLRAEKAFRPH